MTPTPTGRLTATAIGHDLVLTRTFRAPVEDVWASLTEPERTVRWFGSWTGEPGPGRTVQVRMVYEEGAEPAPLEILTCDPPSHLAVRMSDAEGVWHLEAHLTETAGTTTLDFTQHLDDTAGVHDIGPGWEYYLDMLVAAHQGDPQPEWGDSYLAMKPYYQELLDASTASADAR